jgi:hypothetical protein
LSLASSLATMFESDICEMSLDAATSPPDVELFRAVSLVDAVALVAPVDDPVAA